MFRPTTALMWNNAALFAHLIKFGKPPALPGTHRGDLYGSPVVLCSSDKFIPSPWKGEGEGGGVRR